MTQKQLFYKVSAQIGERDRFVMDELRSDRAEEFRRDLKKLIEKYPEKYGKYKGLV